MRKVFPWLAGLVVFLVLTSIIFFGAGYLQNRGILQNTRFVQQRIASNNWHHHGFGLRWGFPFIGMLGGLLILIITGGLIALIVIGVYLIARPTSEKDNQHDKSFIINCPNCGKEIEHGWQVCPYCGESLRED